MFRLGARAKANLSHVACKWAPKNINKKSNPTPFIAFMCKPISVGLGPFGGCNYERVIHLILFYVLFWIKYNKFRISPLLFNAQRINYYKQIKALTMASTRGKEFTMWELSFPRLEANVMKNKTIYLLICPNSRCKLEEASPNLSTNEEWISYTLAHFWP